MAVVVVLFHSRVCVGGGGQGVFVCVGGGECVMCVVSMCVCVCVCV